MQKLVKTTKSKISGGLYVTSFYNMYVQNLKYNRKGALHVSSDCVWYSIHFDIVC